MFNDLLAMGAGRGEPIKNRVIFFDCCTNNSYLWQGYDAECLEKVSGNFRSGITVATNITFTFNVSGKVKFGVAYNGSSVTMQLNGVNVINQEVDVKSGDTLYISCNLYNYPVIILNPDITQS